MTNTLARWSAPASLVACVLWLLIWLHQRVTHGPTATNEMRLLFGLTWMDSAKFLVVPPLLLLIVIISLYRKREHVGWPGRLGVVMTGVGLGFQCLSIAVEFWPFPWGSYAVSFEDAALPRIGGIIQALSSLVFSFGFIVLNVDLVRGRVMPVWAAPVLILGGLTTFFLTPVSWLPGMAWLLLGVVCWQKKNPGLLREAEVASGSSR